SSSAVVVVLCRFCLCFSGGHRDLLSFPTRRSSDLTGWVYADLLMGMAIGLVILPRAVRLGVRAGRILVQAAPAGFDVSGLRRQLDRKSTRLNSSHVKISYAVFCLKKKKRQSQGVGS